MGHTAPDWEMVQSKGEFHEKFNLEGKDDSHNLLSNMVDVRACYKPSEKSWFRGVRSSKFRHVYGVPAKREKCYDNIKITKNAHDSQFCAVNPKFLAIVTEVAGGGAFLVLPLDNTGRLDFNASRVTGHTGPVLDIKWNPFNDNVIASCSDDCTVIYLNIKGFLFHRILQEGVCHAGTKASKVVFLGSSGRLLTTGFSRHSDRQYAVWSQHDLSNPLACETIDSSSGIVFPFYDHDTNMVYLAGKGDGNIRYYEVANEAPWVHFLSQFISGNPQRGLGIMPKRGVSTSTCEVFRFFKLHATRGMCEPISMIVPRKSDQFQEDLYPDTIGTMPGLSAKDWISGMNSPPLLISLKTGGSITTHKPRVYKPPQLPPATDVNNKKKFAFLSTETVPDYRSVELLDMSEKSQKTSCNQLQQKFSHLQNNIVSEQNNKLEEDIPNNEAELRLAFATQTDELRLVRRQLANSQLRVKELEEQVRKLQNH
ncbi:coronin-2A-like [Belonocnema kinseyi]|uniref:coronin-2A-like n=1 Tax=Belonocnema kinseyi TaxID=2817044 RepID=UPI00143DBBA8|nr:coronin-2A-like [Belonocnema kinseyi]